MPQWEYLFLTLTGTGKTLSSTSTQAKYRVNGENLQVAKQSSISRNLGTRANVHISIFLMALPFEQMHNASVISCVTCSRMPTSIRQEILLLL